MDEQAKNNSNIPADMRRSFGTNDVITSGGKSNASNANNRDAVFEEGTFITKEPVVEHTNTLVEEAKKTTTSVA